MNYTMIIVQDGKKYFYTTDMVHAENALGIVKATLLEYSIYTATENDKLLCKLYRTKDGYWYDMPGQKTINALLSTLLKKTIDEYEKAKLLSIQ